ncbi:serine--tRNA ligase, partial [Candidatus Woesearchaeota archaeon]|nr:serine--tRNA ligase [Candidatus Woesearchaeota archaeon]
AKFHEELLKNAEEFFESLGLHCRTMLMCTAEMGTVAAKKYDIEAWMPAQKAYREVVSCSNCTDYQSRRLAIRSRGKDSNRHVHTLNSTCVATSRALVAIIENYQQKDGTIRVPKALLPYMNGIKVIGKKAEEKVVKKKAKKK